MKIGPKLAVCFVVLAVLPLGIASGVYLGSTADFGRQMADLGKELLSDRLTKNLRRANEHGAIAFAETRDRLSRAARFLAKDAAARLDTTPDVPDTAPDQGSFALADDAEEPSSPGKEEIDLERLHVRVADDASKDRVSGILGRLEGLPDVARTVYLRNRSMIEGISFILEDGVTLSFPGESSMAGGDAREQDWYIRALERGTPGWFQSTDTQSVIASAPIQRADGRLAGVAKIKVRLHALLARTLDPTRLPPEASAHYIRVRLDSPQWTPHEVATLEPGASAWKIAEADDPYFLEGDDAWLKVVSDIRTGVPGMEFVTRGGVEEVWAFSPLGETASSTLHLALVYPQKLIDSAHQTAEDTVNAVFTTQARNSILIAIATAIVAALLGLFAARALTRPIRDLHRAAGALGRGDFSVRIKSPGGDELGDLARDFNRMVPALEEQLRVKRDLHAAREIQQHLIPKDAPQLTGFDIAGRTVYCDETGGDYQDFISLDDGGLAVAIGDVTGHGVGAALLMTSARAALRAVARQSTTPDEIMNAVNLQLHRDAARGRFLTLFYMHVKPDKRDISWVSAGHEPVLIYDPGEDTFSNLDGGDIPLGVDGEWTFGANTSTIPKDGILIAVTDGVRETANGAGEHYGNERLKAAVRNACHRGSAAICEHVLGDIDTFRGDTKARDDLSILVVRPK